MSYCRADGIDSDVYVIRDIRGGWACFCAGLVKRDSRRKMLAHLRAHIRKGDRVPEYAIARFERELTED